MSGTEFLERSMDVRPDAIRIILTGYTDVDALVQAVNLSRIYRYVTKPWDSEELRLTLLRAIEAFHLTRENARLVEELRRANERLAVENAYLRESATPPTEIVGESGAIRRGARRWSARVAPIAEHRADRGRDRHRQGAGGARHPRRQPAPRRAVRRGELRVALGGRPRERAVRPPPRRVHRRGRRPQGPLRGRRRRHAVPRRDVGDHAGAAGEAAARRCRRARSGPSATTAPIPVDVRVIAATNRHLERRDQGGPVPRGPVLPPARLPDPHPAAARAPRGHPGAGAPPGAPARGAAEEERRRADARSRSSSSCAIPFPGNVRELANELERAILLAEPGAPITEDLLSEHVQESAADRRPAGRAPGPDRRLRARSRSSPRSSGPAA